MAHVDEMVGEFGAYIEECIHEVPQEIRENQVAEVIDMMIENNDLTALDANEFQSLAEAVYAARQLQVYYFQSMESDTLVVVGVPAVSETEAWMRLLCHQDQCGEFDGLEGEIPTVQEYRDADVWYRPTTEDPVSVLDEEDWA